MKRLLVAMLATMLTLLVAPSAAAKPGEPTVPLLGPKVTYKVTSTLSATTEIRYNVDNRWGDGTAQYTRPPWSIDTYMNRRSPYGFMWVSAKPTNEFYKAAKLTCSIAVNGKVLTTRIGTGYVRCAI